MINNSLLWGLLKSKRLTQKELASMIGITNQTLSLKMSGKVQFKQKEIKKISEILNIPKNEIGQYFFQHKCKRYFYKERTQQNGNNQNQQIVNR